MVDAAREMPAVTPEMIAAYAARTVTVRRSDVRAAIEAIRTGQTSIAEMILVRALEGNIRD